MFDQASPLKVEILENNPFWSLLAYGFVNPYGPTLKGLAIVSDEKSELAPIVYYSLNPFQQKILALAHFSTSDDLDELVRGAIDKFDLRPSETPTIVIPSQQFTNADMAEIFELVLEKVTDLHRTDEQCRKYLGNPWDRVSAEMKSAISAAQIVEEGRSTSPYHTLQDIQNYLALVTSKQHFLEELKAFAYAWSGSINFQESNEVRELDNTVFPYERFIVLFQKILHGGPRAS